MCLFGFYFKFLHVYKITTFEMLMLGLLLLFKLAILKALLGLGLRSLNNGSALNTPGLAIVSLNLRN